MSFSALAFLTGTLIVVAPTSEGLVVAADSLAIDYVSKRRCESERKIFEIEAVDRTVVALTGASGIKGGRTPYRCGRNVPYLDTFHIPSEFQKYVETERKDAETVSIPSFLPQLRLAFSRLSEQQRKVLSSRFPNKPFAILIVATYDAKRSISIVRTAKLGFKAGSLFIGEEGVKRFSPRSAFDVGKYGEADYAERGLSNGTLRKLFTDQESARVLATHVPVKTVGKAQVIRAATDLIGAVSTQMKTIPSKSENGPVTVGGPVDVIFLGRDARPERVQWKSDLVDPILIQSPFGQLPPWAIKSLPVRQSQEPPAAVTPPIQSTVDAAHDIQVEPGQKATEAVPTANDAPARDDATMEKGAGP